MTVTSGPPKKWNKYRPRTYEYRGIDIKRSEGQRPTYSCSINSCIHLIGIPKLKMIKKMINVYKDKL